VDLTPGQRGSVEPPPRTAAFAAKMDYYRSQHTTKGVRATHLAGIPGVAFSIPVMFAKPRVGVPAFLVSWALQVAGHVIFEKNSPALSKGFFTYQFCGLAFWCEEIVDLISGKGLGGTDHPVVTIPESATASS
jgi:uncharacterized membrane protein YGL010W